MKAIFKILVLLITAGSSFGQNGAIAFKHITTDEGLSQSTITGILQDDDGFMWFATHDGLNKYDGNTIRIYKYDPTNPKSLSHNFIHTIFKDRSSNLWLGTDEGGLIFFDRENDSFTSYNHNPEDSTSLSHVRVQTIEQDPDGNLWVGTYGGGINYFDVKSGRFTRYRHEPNNNGSLSSDHISDILVDRSGNVWIATFNGGLNLFDRDSKSFERFLHDPQDQNSLSHNGLSKIMEDSHGNLWVGTEGRGLNLFDRQRKSCTRFVHEESNSASLSHNDILSLQEDNYGNLWVGTRNGGISILSHDAKVFTTLKHDENNDETLNNNSIYSLYKDRHGNMWVGTYSGGVNFASSLKPKFKSYKNEKTNANSLSNNNVLSILEDHNGLLWLGTDGGGLNVFDRKKNKFQKYVHSPGDMQSIRSDYVLDIFEDRDQDLWTGNFKGGINLRMKGGDKFLNFHTDPLNSDPYNESIWQIIQDKKGYLWVATYGLSRYDKINNTFENFLPDPNAPGSISYPLIFALCEDSKGNIWAGTAGGGLNLFHEDTKTFTHYKHNLQDTTSISSSHINAIAEDSKGNLWIGTNSGLNLFHPESNTFSVFNEDDGLPNNVVYGIQEDNHGNLWLSTNKGLSKFNPDKRTFRNYDVSDGLLGNSFNRMSFYKNGNGEIFFGGMNGFSVFHPDSIVDNPVIPAVHITNFEIFNKPVTVHQKDSPLKKAIHKTDEIVLSYKESVFSFEFAALNYTSPEKNQYAYKLEGFDKDWIYTYSTKAIYTNLNPGEYIFRVKASNNDGVWNDQGTALTIIITPPFWRTWIFKIIVALMLVAGVYIFFRIRLSIINKQKIALEKEVKRQTAEVRQQKEALEIEREEAEKARHDAEQANRAKSIFLATMSHEIRTPMNGVLGMASLLAETIQTREQREYTDAIQSSGQALLTVINDILDFSKIESGNLELDNQSFDLRQCIEDVMDIFSAKASENGIDLLYRIDHALPTYILGDKHRLRQILINLVSNAIKFTLKGEIFVGVNSVKITSDTMEIGFHVRDTGIGIPPDKLSRLFKAFSQVDSATNRKYGGTGLGLVISQRLVELMGGRIEIESQPDVGTTFKFSILTQVIEHDTKIATQPAPDNEGKRILVVDENPTSLNVLKDQLEHWKLSTTLASSGQEALDILDQPGFFDLALIDMQMPHMDGLELSKRIKAKLPHLPIILISTIGDESTRRHHDLFSSVLCKPVKQHQLARDIQAALMVERKQVRINEAQPKYILSEDFAEKFPLRIMLAEDNLVNQKLAIRILNKLGYHHIEVAQNGLEAIEKLKVQFYELILMDMQMPEMDGLEATRRIREHFSQQPIIVAMTANALQSDRELCLQAGMNEYLTKPIKLELLMNALQTAAESYKLVAVQKKI